MKGTHNSICICIWTGLERSQKESSSSGLWRDHVTIDQSEYRGRSAFLMMMGRYALTRDSIPDGRTDADGLTCKSGLSR